MKCGHVFEFLRVCACARVRHTVRVCSWARALAHAKSCFENTCMCLCDCMGIRVCLLMCIARTAVCERLRERACASKDMQIILTCKYAPSAPHVDCWSVRFVSEKQLGSSVPPRDLSHSFCDCT